MTSFTQKYSWQIGQEHESGHYFVTETHQPFPYELPHPAVVYGPIPSRAMAEGLILERKHMVTQVYARVLERLRKPILLPLDRVSD